MKYASAVATAEGERRVTEALERENGHFGKESVHNYSLERHEVLSDEDIREIDEAYERMLKLRTKKQFKETLLRPEITSSNAPVKKVAIPLDSLRKTDNYIGLLVIALAHKLGYEIYNLKYEGEFRSLTDECDDIAAGMFAAYKQNDLHINLSSKVSSVELGRTYARAIQVQGLIGADKKLGPESLKFNHRFFGNNPREYDLINKVPVSVKYFLSELPNLFHEMDWAKELAHVLVRLLKESHIFLTKEIRESCISSNVLSYSEVVERFCTKPIVIEPARGRKPATVRNVIPHKPRPNAMFIKDEYDFIMKQTESLWTSPSFAKDSASWVKHICEHGFLPTKKEIIEHHNEKAAFLTKFASISTKRLREYRGVPNSVANKRKKDISRDDVNLLLERRADVSGSLIRELISLDPTFKGPLFGIAKRNLPTETKGLSYGEQLALSEKNARIELLTEAAEIPGYKVIIEKRKLRESRDLINPDESSQRDEAIRDYVGMNETVYRYETVKTGKNDPDLTIKSRLPEVVKYKTRRP
jgi:hypothetical protein